MDSPPSVSQTRTLATPEADARAPTAPRPSTDAPDATPTVYGTPLRMILPVINHCDWCGGHLRQPGQLHSFNPRMARNGPLGINKLGTTATLIYGLQVAQFSRPVRRSHDAGDQKHTSLIAKPCCGNARQDE